MTTDAKVTLSAEDKTRAAFAQVSQSFDKLGTATEAVASKFGLLFGAGGLGVAGLTAMVTSVNNGVDALNDIKDATGASIENISGLEDVALRTGTSIETVSTALIKFNKALIDAKPGSDTAEILKSIGLNAEALKKLDPAEALLQTAKALNVYADDGNKARITQELFGKSLKEVAPLLKDLAEKGELVAKVTSEQADEAERFNKQLFNLQKNSLDFKRVMVSDLVQGINEAAKALKDSGLIEGFRTLFTGNDEYKNNKRLVELTDELFRAENQLSKFNQADARIGLTVESPFAQATRKKIEALKEELQTVQAYKKVIDDTRKAAEAPPKPSAPNTGGGGGAKPETDKVNENQRSLAQYVKGLESAIDKTKDLTEVEKAQSYLRSLGIMGEIAQVQELVLNLAKQIDLEKEQAIVLKEKRNAAIASGEAVNKENEAYQKRLKTLLDNTPSAKLNQQIEDIRLLEQEFAEGRITEAQYTEAAMARMDMLGEKVKETKSFAEEMGLTFSSAFEDAIVGGKNFSDILKGLETDILRIAARRFITEPVGKAATSFFDDIFKSLPKFDGGGFTGSGTRSGGLDGKGGFLSVLHPDETVVDHTKGQQLAGGSNVVVNVIESTDKAGTQQQRTEQGVNVIDVFVERVKSSIAGDVATGSGSVTAAFERTYGLNRSAGAY